MKKINLRLLKKFLKNIYIFIKNNISYYRSYKYDKKVYKKLNSLTENKIATKNKESFIIDGHYYNFGYFFRLQLIRNATESYLGREVGFIYKYNQKKCTSFLKNTGVSIIEKMPYTFSSDVLFEANQIFKKINRPEDILEIRLPHNAPANHLYDYIIKRQKLGKVNVEDENIPFYISEYIESIRFSERIIEEYDPKMIFMSHVINIQCYPLCYLALKKDIKVLNLYGNYGVPRFIKVNIQDRDMGYNFPLKEYLKKLNSTQIELLKEVGNEYLNRRLNGETNDFGGKLAYDTETKDINSLIKNKGKKPIIAIYASNWFDHPHTYGMRNFRDFEDWIITTYRAILDNTEFIWLFRAHPGEDWYGGITLKDILPSNLPDHILLLPKQLSGKSVMNISSGLITMHGTAGLEYASCGKPVMIADKGWYHDAGFTINPSSRKDYIDLLSKNWLLNFNSEEFQRNAKIFAGLYFCCPKWQKNLLMRQDIYQNENKKNIFDYIDRKSDLISEEIKNIQNWLDSDYTQYQTFNMLNSYEYSNIT